MSQPVWAAGAYGLPEGVSLGGVLAVLIPAAVVTMLLRQAPFSALALLKNSGFVKLLGYTMPVGVMTVLAVYTLHTEVVLQGQSIIASLVGVGVTVLLHALRRDAALSIIGGTIAYMLMLNLGGF